MQSPFMLDRSFLALTLVILWLSIVPARAEKVTPPEQAWQTVITQQIEAFRAGDAPAAFSLAGDGFQRSFPNAFVFFRAIMASGYAPIMESQSHSFGDFSRVDDASVVQTVKFVGPSLELYQAAYRLTEEAGGWRIQGVALSRQPGMAI